MIAFLPAISYSQVNILTANGSNDRTNSNLQETQLSPATVNATSFGKLGTFPVDGQVYAQPLFVSGLSVAGVMHNVVFVTTMHNSVYAFDADSTAPVSMLWQVNLGASVPSRLLFGPNGDIANEVGILSTGVIDLARRVIYVVSDTLENGAPVFHIHALDLATGAERLNGPVIIKASVAGSGSETGADGMIPFDPQQHIQRPGLLLANSAVYVAFGSHGDQNPYHGWMMAYDAADLSHQVGVYLATPDGNAGAIWQSGRGPAADPQGNLYVITGNGDYDGTRNFGQSFLKVSANLSTTLDWYTPANWKDMSDNDDDLSGGPALISGTHTVLGTDKGGNLYVVNGDQMKAPFGGVIVPVSTGAIFNFAVWSRTGDALVYTQGSGEPLKCYRISGAAITLDPVTTTGTPVPYSRIGLTLSANGSQADSGILWENTGDYFAGTAGTLHAYDASNLTNELWNSDTNSDRDSLPALTKFVAPTVANGKVYVASSVNAVTVYGLLAPGEGDTTPAISYVANAASYSKDAVSPGQVVAIFGSHLGPSVPAGLQLTDGGTVATTLAGTQVSFDGLPSPLVFTSDGQVNAIVPFAVTGVATQVQVQYEDQVSDPFAIALAPATSAIFTADASGTGAAMAVNPDGSINSPVFPAPAGSVVTLWATGAGEFQPPGGDGTVVGAGNLPVPVLAVQAQIGGLPADVLYAGGAPGYVEGVIQLNLRIPAASPTGGAVPVVVRIGDSSSQPGVTLAIRSP